MALSNLHVQKSVNALNEELRSSKSRKEKEELVIRHLQVVESDERYAPNVELPSGLQWFNVSKELKFSDQLKGKLVVLDFFTYCCINCLHILPDLHSLEEQYKPEEGVVIIGVHSAKFPNEKGLDNLRNAILRYSIAHPVINDVDIELWERLAVSCWPTLIFISPQGRLIHYIIGEGHAQEMTLFTDIAFHYYKEKKEISLNSIGLSLEKDAPTTGQVLSFPGKIAANETHVFLADSGNHRVLVVNRDSRQIEHVFGSDSGLQDGAGKGAKFNSPQGVVVYNKQLFVTDTENHCVRKINLTTSEVSTVLGTGRQGNDKEGGAKGREQEISSPWDLAVIKGPGADHCNILCVANAGTHQIWAYFMEDSKWFQGSNHTHGTAIRMSGSGDEANRNNTFPHKASFAQPSGLAVDYESNTMYVADSESSTVRCVSVLNGSVKGLIGGGLDPMDLFAFGDKDGKGREVRLQHPLGVAWDSHNKLLYIADSYNHKIKVCDPLKKSCSTLAGTGVPGLINGSFSEAQFSEPGGLCVTDKGKTLFVCDTNNHHIRKLNLMDKTVETFDVLLNDHQWQQQKEKRQLGEESTDCSSYVPITNKRAKHVRHSSAIVVPGPLPVTESRVKLSIRLMVTLPSGYKMNEEMASIWQIVPVLSQYSSVTACKGSFDNGVAHISLECQFPVPGDIKVELVVYYCSLVEGTCLMHQALLTIPVELSDKGSVSTTPRNPNSMTGVNDITVNYTVSDQ